MEFLSKFRARNAGLDIKRRQVAAKQPASQATPRPANMENAWAHANRAWRVGCRLAAVRR